jgi:hypothetical protein
MKEVLNVDAKITFDIALQHSVTGKISANSTL